MAKVEYVVYRVLEDGKTYKSMSVCKELATAERDKAALEADNPTRTYVILERVS